MKLNKHKLGELIEVTRGASLAGTYYATEGNLIRLTLGNFDYQNGGFQQNTSKDNIYFTGDVKDAYILKKGDIITPLTEQTPGLLGSTAIIPEDNKYIQSQDIALVKCKEGLDPLFCYYLLPSQSVKNQLSAAAQQTKIRHTTPDRIKETIVFVPEIEEQRLIGKMLFAIDQKIQLNRAINRNLSLAA
jgi:type I restriction enzyme S subunit